VLGGDFFQDEIAADAAVGVKQVAKRQRTCVKATLTFLATPRNDSHQRKKMVLQISTPGAAIARGKTDWAGYLQELGKLPGTSGE
jgi:hypothetical protein